MNVRDLTFHEFKWKCQMLVTPRDADNDVSGDPFWAVKEGSYNVVGPSHEPEATEAIFRSHFRYTETREFTFTVIKSKVDAFFDKHTF